MTNVITARKVYQATVTRENNGDKPTYAGLKEGSLSHRQIFRFCSWVPKIKGDQNFRMGSGGGDASEYTNAAYLAPRSFVH